MIFKRKRTNSALLTVGITALLSISGCTTLGYYAQSISGHISVLMNREPVAEILARDDTPEVLRAKLNLVLKARTFASETLKLPENDSYRSYADLKRPYAVWNVVATEEFSIQAQQWCFLFVGCIKYRGYYDKQDAHSFGQTLIAQGSDVYVYGVAAYSTLGWFDDPIFNTVLRYKDTLLAGLIFHELSHQQLYISGDTAFNEGFAVAVELAGIEKWLKLYGSEKDSEDYRQHKLRKRDFINLIAGIRKQLEELYKQELTEQQKRQQKTAIIKQLHAQYQIIKTQWGGYSGFDKWFAKKINNAQLASVATYEDYVPAFQKLLTNNNNDLVAFYAAVKEIGDLPKAEREQEMARLSSQAKAARIN